MCKRKIAFDTVRDIVKSHNAKLLTEKIDSKNKKIEIICENNHSFKIRFDHVLNGPWCKECQILKRRKNLMPS